MEKKNSIGDLLLELGKISQEDLEEGLRLQKVFNLRLGETLVKLGKITMADIEWVLSKQLDIPFVIVENINIDQGLLYKFSQELLVKNRILPLYETNEEIAIATDDPLNKEVFESIEGFFNKK
jgi:type IV pilus assembly protein PilB